MAQLVLENAPNGPINRPGNSFLSLPIMREVDRGLRILGIGLSRWRKLLRIQERGRMLGHMMLCLVILRLHEETLK